MPRVADVEEEDAVLPLEQAEQAAAREHLLVPRRVAVVRLVADVPRRRDRHGAQHLAVGRRVAVEVDDREEENAPASP